MIDVSFTPDWSETMTASEAESEFPTFVFKGPGWHIEGNDTFLVVPLNSSSDPFKQTWPADTEFMFHCFNGRNPGPTFGFIATAPTRQDNR